MGFPSDGPIRSVTLLPQWRKPGAVLPAPGFLVSTACGTKRKTMEKNSKHQVDVNRYRKGWTAKALVLAQVCFGIAAVLKAATPMLNRLLGV